jgi:hypothetical protein
MVLQSQGNLIAHRLLKRQAEVLPHLYGQVRPDMHSDETLRIFLEEFSRLLVDVRVAPLGVEREEPVRDALQYFRGMHSHHAQDWGSGGAAAVGRTSARCVAGVSKT